ncbi:TonB-dependent receptor [Pseudoxanthomonas suwonensis]|uniref:TonB-dependent receptor n=1 Tax=Pseudoxanthomonas suwonensis TaxID=314722 RepID=A0A0E3Z3W6_9GAMM|nr:TonB-dependent receptor [Pseudoxanthomonas suwonensis]AKC86908.1 TonB-dependent receptor [Pseudoxanthomonas suwonensis]
MKHVQALPKKRLLASALLLAMAPATQALAQEQIANANADADPTELDTVVVTGIRASLTSSMNLKRDAQGIVDGIVAEDIGKFPDTNLAEALQRISGVSIDRTSSGEGSRVTVRGVGPDFNLVLLNGRQMPASNLGPGGGGTSNSRSFDFANIAAEAISAIEVHKTGRAELPTGGIGATLNVKTARPLEIGEPLASIGFKTVHDRSARNLPQSFPSAIVTPELSGIFSNTYADGRFGITLSGSYQERESGYSQASVADGWITFAGDDTNSWNRLPQPGESYSDRITNIPTPDNIYARPQNTGYSVNGVQRQRTNGQLTLQWAPTDNVTATLDYAYMENKVQQQRSELSVWFTQGPGDSSWTDGPVAAPIIYSEDMVGSDLSMGGMQLATKNSGDSLGFNVEWELSDALKLQFDYHNSKAESRPDSHLGSAGVLGVAAFVRGNTTVDYSGEIPIVNVLLPPGMSAVQAADALVTGSVFQNSYNRSDVEQFQAGGRFQFGDYSGLDFGVAATEVNNRTAAAVMQRDNWGGVGSPADYDDSIWHADRMSRYFKSFGNSGNPNWTDDFLVFDFERLRQAAIAVTGCAECYEMPTEFTDDLRTTEKSRSAYLQYTTSFDWSMPLDVAVGVRYEKTDVDSSALVRIANGISWDAANELYVTYEPGQGFTELEGDYDYFLPNLDLALHITDELVLRSSYSETIGRPGWQQIQGGQRLANIVRVDGGDGSRGNPALEPLLSRNFDLSLEWYYGESSYASIGYFRKNIKNFISDTIVRETPFELHTPVGGAYWNAAIAGGCASTDMPCIRDYIFTNFAGSPGVTVTGTNSAGQLTGSIVGQPGDPIAGFDITTPANQRSDHLDGFEINIQHVFGESGFGLAANYTKVDSGLTFDNTNLGTQYPMVGLSDSANVVAFYDKNKWQVRAAYNWRDEFLNGIGGGGTPPNPNWTEAYGQLDAIISYEVMENLTLSLEGINLTDETQRIHARHENMVRFATQTGPRYMFGVRYRF